MTDAATLAQCEAISGNSGKHSPTMTPMMSTTSVHRRCNITLLRQALPRREHGR